jgi:hypothetical protein
MYSHATSGLRNTMSFFLIGLGPDDDLRLLSLKPLESRQAAMAELSRLSADPAFDHWDADVTVMDLNTGAPVLLVRPAAAAVPIEPEPERTQTGDADVWEADLPSVETVVPPAIALVEVKESLADTPEVIPEAIPEAIEAPFWEPPSVALIEPVGDAAIAEAIVADAEEPVADVEAFAAASVPDEVELVDEPTALPEPVVEIAPETLAEPLAELPALDENDELRAAIVRTTEHMAAEGVVAPESIGPEIVALESIESDEAQVVPEDVPPIEVATAAQTASVADDVIELEEPADVAAAPSFWPWNRSAQVDAPESGVAPEVAGVYDALGSSAEAGTESDVEAVLRRPVVTQRSDQEPDLPEAASPREPMSYISETEPEAPSGESDFILDLDSVESPPEAIAADDTPAEAVSVAATDSPVVGEEAVHAEAQAPAAEPLTRPDVSPLEDFTCADCVYTDTCPNRDQRLPKDCGSFQWR